MTERNALWRVVAAIMLAALVAAMVIAQLGRGPWYDEFYTFYVTPGGANGAALLETHWLADNHPPLFYALSWATAWLGPTVEMRRLVNLLVLAMGLAALVVLGRLRPEWRRLAVPYGVALAGFWPAIERAAELRSNYLAFVASAVMVAALSAIAVPDESRPERAEALLLTVVLAVAINVHLVASLINLCVAGAFGLRLLLKRDWQRARLLAAAGVIAALPLAATLAMQFGRIEANTRAFWIPPGLNAARWAIENELIAEMLANPALALAGLAGLVLAALASLRAGRLDPRLGTAATLTAGCALAAALLLAAHLWRPIVIQRYLVALAPPLGLCLAIGAAALVERCRPRLASLVVGVVSAGAFLAIALHLQATLALPSWNGTGRAIAEQVSRCPATRVHADLYWNRATIDLPPTDNRAVMPAAYRWIAARNGFRLEPSGSRAMAGGGCPTLFWTEHVAGERPSPREVADRLRGQGFAIGAARLERIGDGWLLYATKR